MKNRSESYAEAVGSNDTPAESAQMPITRIRPSRAPPAPIRESSLEESQFGDDRTLLEYYLAKRKAEYSSPVELNIFAGSFNVNGKEPKELLDKWLVRDDLQPDLIVIGIQELQLDADAYLSEYVNSKESDKYAKCQALWRTSITNSLEKYKGEYGLVTEERLVGMYIMIFCTRSVRPAITRIARANVGCGIMGTFGNKGACSISMRIHETTFCFITSHLAAHQHAIRKRNQDFESIRQRTIFNPSQMQILDHERVFWLGDLNYRLNLPNEEVRKMCLVNDVAGLLTADQLQGEMASGKVFRGFQEAPIYFKPTYKFDGGTNNYDSSPKNRIPAYTDRVLWLSKEPDAVECLGYHAHPTITISDHKPVSAIFRARTEKINSNIYNKVYRDVTTWLDKHENELIPQVAVSSKAIDFGRLRFHDIATANIQLRNTGKTPAQYHIIDSKLLFSQDKEAYEAFKSDFGLSITPNKGILPPDSGEASICTITMSLNISKDVVSKYNFGVQQGSNYVSPLDDVILILKLKNGPEHYITLTGQWAYSAFGMPRRALCNPLFKDVPISSLDFLNTSVIIHNLGEAQEQTGCYIPVQLYKLIDEVHRRGIDAAQLFQINGDEDEVRAIIDIIDNEPSIQDVQLMSLRATTNIFQVESLPGSVASVAEVLLLYLNAMPDPIIPSSHYELCIDQSDSPHLCQNILIALSDDTRTIFEYLVGFLLEILKNSDLNGTNAEFLGRIFADCILRPEKLEKDSRTNASNKKKSVKFVRSFLTVESDLI